MGRTPEAAEEIPLLGTGVLHESAESEDDLLVVVFEVFNDLFRSPANPENQDSGSIIMRSTNHNVQTTRACRSSVLHVIVTPKNARFLNNSNRQPRH